MGPGRQRTIWRLFCSMLGTILSLVSPEMSDIERSPLNDIPSCATSLLRREHAASIKERRSWLFNSFTRKPVIWKAEGGQADSKQCLMRYLDVPPKMISRSCCQRFALWLYKDLFTTACEAKTATCKLCEMTFIPSPAITGSVSATHLGTVVGFQHYNGGSFWFVLSRSGEH